MLWKSKTYKRRVAGWKFGLVGLAIGGFIIACGVIWVNIAEAVISDNVRNAFPDMVSLNNLNYDLGDIKLFFKNKYYTQIQASGLLVDGNNNQGINKEDHLTLNIEEFLHESHKQAYNNHTFVRPPRNNRLF